MASKVAPIEMHETIHPSVLFSGSLQTQADVSDDYIFFMFWKFSLWSQQLETGFFFKMKTGTLENNLETDLLTSIPNKSVVTHPTL